MKIFVKAYIEWVLNIRITKKSKYCPLIHIDQQDVCEPNWSAEIFLIEHININESIVNLSFLSPDAPFALLKHGYTFKLFEGRTLVAIGHII